MRLDGTLIASTRSPTPSEVEPGSTHDITAERVGALLKRTWRALERVTPDPCRLGTRTAALVLLHVRRPSR